MHNLVNLGYLSVRGDCFSIMKCAPRRDKAMPDTWKADAGPLTKHVAASNQPWHDSVATPTQGITHVNLASESEPHLSFTNTAFTKITWHRQAGGPTLGPQEEDLKEQELQFSIWDLGIAVNITWMKSRNVRGSKSSMCPMSLEKRFKILPARTGYEKLLISPDRPLKRNNS